MVSKLRIALVLLAITPTIAGAQSTPDTSSTRIDVPVLDVPYNTANGFRAPSMQQSQALTEMFYELTHRAIQDAWGEHTWYARFSIIGADIADSLILPLPGSDGWVHEEFHRTILGQRGFGSFNDVYKFKVAADSIAVSHVEDADLVQLKREHPAEQVRLSAAGLEGEQQFVLGLQKREFFDRRRSFQMPIYWLEKLGGLSYVASGTSNDTNLETDEMNAREGTDVSVRDFTGHDFTAWVYDLHRPFEPYEARGVHPSGVGLDRYIKPSDLTSDELSYLRKQGRLQALNFLDPFLVAYRGMTMTVHGEPLRLNANISHVLTSFGRTVDTNVFVARGHLNLLTTVHSYANGERSFAGVDATLIDYPLVIRGRTLTITPRVALWQQPEGQLFRSTNGDVGGLVAVKIQHTRGPRFGAFAELQAKSAGWVAGVESLDRNVSLRVGLSVILR
jgi:hypothetical protein